VKRMRPGSSAAASRSRTRLAHRHSDDTGHDFALRQMAVADNTLPTVLSLDIGMLGEEIRDLGLYSLGEQRARARRKISVS
jgi:hypothetical protein